jgi:putative endonuclease
MVEIKTKSTEKILYKSNQKIPKPKKDEWYVYVLQCKDDSLYTGVTNDLIKRMKTHESGKGSKYVKAKGFKTLLRFKKCDSKSDAQKAEYQIKHLPTSQKLNWFAQNKNILSSSL